MTRSMVWNAGVVTFGLLMLIGTVEMTLARENRTVADGLAACEDYCRKENRTLESRQKCIGNCVAYWCQNGSDAKTAKIFVCGTADSAASPSDTRPGAQQGSGGQFDPSGQAGSAGPRPGAVQPTNPVPKQEFPLKHRGVEGEQPEGMRTAPPDTSVETK